MLFSRITKFAKNTPLPTCPLFFAKPFIYFNFFITINREKKWASGQKVVPGPFFFSKMPKNGLFWPKIAYFLPFFTKFCPLFCPLLYPKSGRLPTQKWAFDHFSSKLHSTRNYFCAKPTQKPTFANIKVGVEMAFFFGKNRLLFQEDDSYQKPTPGYLFLKYRMRIHSSHRPPVARTRMKSTIRPNKPLLRIMKTPFKNIYHLLWRNANKTNFTVPPHRNNRERL